MAPCRVEATETEAEACPYSHINLEACMGQFAVDHVVSRRTIAQAETGWPSARQLIKKGEKIPRNRINFRIYAIFLRPSLLHMFSQPPCYTNFLPCAQFPCFRPTMTSQISMSIPVSLPTHPIYLNLVLPHTQTEI